MNIGKNSHAGGRRDKLYYHHACVTHAPVSNVNTGVHVYQVVHVCVDMLIIFV